MKGFLKEADAKQDGDERVKIWIQDVREIAYNSEDIVDTYICKVSWRRLQGQGFMNSLARGVRIFTELKARHKLGMKIDRMRSRIESITQRRTTYGIESFNSLGEEQSSFNIQRLQDWRQSSPHVEATDLVGFENDFETLVRQLISGDQRRRVVSVVGMGGLGKTSLCKKLYNSDPVKTHFDSCVWVCISQEHSVRDLLRKIISGCMVSCEEDYTTLGRMDVPQLTSKLFDHLKEKRYLIVIDDIWKTEAWDGVKDALPDVRNGSRVLLTTRNIDVALYADPSSRPHELRFLKDDESWELFSKKALVGRDDPELQELGKEIVKKCQGLPLAIVVIGGLLSRKDARLWDNIMKSISWRFVKGEIQISKIISLSYHDLPYYLKPCFLYLGIFPEDHEFPAKKLIHLWAAEGFLQQRGEEMVEEVGEDYLQELIQRSLVQVAKKSSSGNIKKCRIHDLLRELAISEAKEEMFLEVHRRGQAAAAPSASLPARRLAIHHMNKLYDSLKPRVTNFRSVLIHTQRSSEQLLDKREEKLLCRSLKLLRVLDLNGLKIRKLPNEIGELVHLRYLGCTDTGITSLPPTVANLTNLQTLYCLVTFEYDYATYFEIPSAVMEMQKVRHLNFKREGWGEGIWGDIRGQPRADRICSSNLQTLKNVRAGEWVDDGCLGRLTNLRTLGICVRSRSGRVHGVWESIARLTELESLFVTAAEDLNKIESLGELPSLQHLRRIHKMHIAGRLESPLLDSLRFPANVTKLSIEFSRLERDPLGALEKLENLRVLRLLEESYVAEEMACSAGGFPRLQSLHLVALRELRVWRVEEGSMPCLAELLIYSCHGLKEVPPGLVHVNSLKKLELWDMSSELKARVQREVGEDWQKIQHVPTIDTGN